MSGSMLKKVDVEALLESVTAVGAGPEKEPWHGNHTYEVYGTTSAGSGSAVVVIEVRNSQLAPYKTLATVTLTLGTAAVSDGATSPAAWRYVRARVTSISGTDATVSANVGHQPL
jgi:hypothetical protein